MYIQPQMRKQATVQRLTTTRGAGGVVVSEMYSEIYGGHIVDLQPLTTSDLTVSEQLKFKFLYRVFPERPNVMPYVQIGDFYYIGQKLYRVMEKFDFMDEGYFQVRDDAAEKFAESAAILQSAFTIDNLGPGVYVYGSGALAGIGPFSAKPILIDTLMNDGGYYIKDSTQNGFEIVDRMIGASPRVSFLIEGILS